MWKSLTTLSSYFCAIPAILLHKVAGGMAKGEMQATIAFTFCI